MERRQTQTINRSADHYRFTNLKDEEPAVRRLNSLIALNAKTARRKSRIALNREKLEAGIMSKRLDLNQTFGYFGLLLGILPPLTLFVKWISLSGLNRENLWLIGILLVVNAVTAVVGYFSGRLIARMVRQSETYPWWAMIFLSPFIGIIWGIIAGGLGGAIFFIVGGIFGAAIGGLVGAAAMPLFLILHRWLKRDEFIETKHFLPIALGITMSICMFILGNY